MGSRGIKSAEEQALVVSGAIVPGQRPEVPTDLDEAERRLWLQISRALPAEWFHTGDPGTLLKLYVRHAVYADVLANQMRGMWPTSTDDTKGWARLRAMMRAHGAQTDKLCQLATKLKLTPSSRYRSDHTERTTRGMGYVPPWEDWGDRRKRS
jgi:hypothetical protein